jgi:hypothetical protein
VGAQLMSAATETKAAIWAAYEAGADGGQRAHLGASIIGKACDQALWFDFRWVTRVKHAGQLLRLFETGQREESRVVSNLRRTGATVLEVDPETGKQFRVTAVDGHFGGSLDALINGLQESPRHWHVGEFKTHNAKSFKDLLEKRVRESKPQHYDQMQIYMRLKGPVWALYVAVNKDTDDLYLERVKYDQEHAERLLERATRVIFSLNPTLAKLSENPSWFECKFCDHNAVCHKTKPGTWAEVNCRTCVHSTPVKGGAWTCELHQTDIDLATQRVGCDRHLYIPQLVNAKQVDANVEWIEYEFQNGERRRDVGIDKGALKNGT